MIEERRTVFYNFKALGNFTAHRNYSLMRISPNSRIQTGKTTNNNINPSQFKRGDRFKELPDEKLPVFAMSAAANQRSEYLLRHNSNLRLDNTFCK